MSVYNKLPMLQGLVPYGFCIGCGFKHRSDYPSCAWDKGY